MKLMFKALSSRKGEEAPTPSQLLRNLRQEDDFSDS